MKFIGLLIPLMVLLGLAIYLRGELDRKTLPATPRAPATPNWECTLGHPCQIEGSDPVRNVCFSEKQYESLVKNIVDLNARLLAQKQIIAQLTDPK